jgi:hypothetical protein
MTTLKIDLTLPEAPAAGEHLLYVVLHGLVSIVETDTHFHLYLLDMESDHRYLVGTWLAEADFPKGASGVLKGVKAGNQGLDPASNPALKITSLPAVHAHGVHGKLVVVKPRALYSLDRGTISIVSGAIDRVIGTPATLSAVRVLEYELETDFDHVGIDGRGFDWIAGTNFTTFGNGSRLATLHIFDMPGGPVPPTHHVDEFALSSNVLGAPIAIGAAIPQAVPNGPLPPGLPALEVPGFDARADEISDLILDFIRTGQWIPRGSVDGSCKTCCGGADGILGA